MSDVARSGENAQVAAQAEADRLIALYARLGMRRETYADPRGATIDMFEMYDSEAISKWVGVRRFPDGGAQALPFFTREGVLDYASRANWVPR